MVGRQQWSAAMSNLMNPTTSANRHGNDHHEAQITPPATPLPPRPTAISVRNNFILRVSGTPFRGSGGGGSAGAPVVATFRRGAPITGVKGILAGRAPGNVSVMVHTARNEGR